MKRTNQYRWIFGLLTTIAMASWTLSQEAVVPQKADDPQDPIEVLTRGPIHEAFAQPVIQEPVAPTPIQKEPPPPIAEEPPQERPDIENAQWIPGYWAWDAEREQFLWVSGVYRVAPQGRTFVPGYWENTPQGWRWIAGFWSDPNQQELPYTPEPPAPIESVQGPAPDENSIYIPGNWIYRNDRFIWRGGYWSAARPGRVWTPSQYYWTPNGYLFNDGFWDEPYDMRGLAYAPVYFNQPLWNNPGWRYRPNFVVSFGAFFDSAFICGNGFYFGNYYGPQYARFGFRPWYQGRGRYDPVFAYHGWQNHRNNPNWINNVQQTYGERNAGRGNLPPRNFAQQTAFVNAKKGGPIVAPAAQFQNDKIRLVKATPTQLDDQRLNGQRTREIAANRQQQEIAATKKGNPNVGNRVNEPRTLNLPTVLATKTNPPRTFEAKGGANLPKIDPTFPKNVQPKVDIRNNDPPPNVAPKFQPKNNNPPPNLTPLPKNVAPKFEPKNNNPPPNVTPLPKNVTPKFEPKNNNPPPNVTPLPKNVTPKFEPKNVNPPAVQPKNVPTPKVEIRNNPPPVVQPKIVQPAPRVNPPVVQPAPRVNPPPVQPKIVQPAPRVNPPPAPAPRVNPAPAPRVNPTPAPAPRVNPTPAPRVNPAPAPRAKTVTAPAPRVQSPAPAPRVQSPPPRANNPSPPRSSPPRSAPKGGKR